MKGFIDLIFRWQGRYFILDWKTNVLEGYEEVHIRSCMEQSGYFLQAAIYTEALQKYLALFEQRSFEEVFGGVIYFFLRGGKPFYFAPDLTLLQTIDGLGGPAWTLAKNSSLL